MKMQTAISYLKVKLGSKFQVYAGKHHDELLQIIVEFQGDRIYSGRFDPERKIEGEDGYKCFANICLNLKYTLTEEVQNEGS